MADSDRFAESQPWRFVVTDLNTATRTFLDKLASNREITKTLNASMKISGSVPSDHPEVNIVAGDGEPFLQEGTRLLYALRRESDTAPKWVCRAAGIVLYVGDQAGPDVSVTDFVAYDPWTLLYTRPVRDSVGDLAVGEGGLTWEGPYPGSEIATDIINRTYLAEGSIYTNTLLGTIEVTDDIEDFTIQQGMSVGEALDQLVETGTLDIEFTPMYDPTGHPGEIAILNIWARQGSPRYDAIFAWDKPSKSAVNMSRARDGLQRANRLQYYIGQGGPAVALVSDPGSIADFGVYYEQQFFPGQDFAAQVLAKAEMQRRIRARGLVTYTLSPTPERSPVPFIDYDIGDDIPIYGSSRMREAVADLKRVQQIPLVIADDQMAAPSQILLADEEAEGS